MAEEEPNHCEIHGLAFTRIVKVAHLEQFNEETRKYEPSTQPLPKRLPEIEYVCSLCDNI